MKVVIIGAGISGLSSYLFLRKHLLSCPPSVSSATSDGASLRHTVKIVESHDIHTTSFSLSSPSRDYSPSTSDTVFTPDAIGSGIGLSTNGLNVLRRIDADGHVLNEVIRRGRPIERWTMRNARGWVMVDVRTAPGDEKKAVQTQKEPKGVPDSIMIARQACWEILRDEVLALGDVMVERRKVVDITIGKQGERCRLKYADDYEEEADLVIGCDGLKSVVRRIMFEKYGEKMGNAADDKDQPSWWQRLGLSKTTPKSKDYVTPHFE